MENPSTNNRFRSTIFNHEVEQCGSWEAQSAVANIPQEKPCGEMLPSLPLSVAAMTASLVEDLSM
ncbi:hypothetical protein F7725_020798 [Dissostichus mawsoni]|uniref:Uncharacterized protein n=1 Tax=Dissostichus mawsoni TaxID=36200 RepID=A0A7J5YEC2_DISMA|nr:hypothetical protein F7725_020798 [Dissostichus mawsoni]